MRSMVKEVLTGVAIAVVSGLVLDRSRGGYIRRLIPEPSKLVRRHQRDKMHSV